MLAPPPGNFSPPAEGPPPSQRNPHGDVFCESAVDAARSQLNADPSQSTYPWHSWSQVPRTVAQVLPFGPFFLEVFAGEAGFTAEVAKLGVPVLPPIDVEQAGLVQEPQDLLDAAFFGFLITLLLAGAVFFLHLGTPCGTFSIVRTRQPGPAPLRSAGQPLGLDGLNPGDREDLWLGNHLLFLSIELMEAVLQTGGDVSLENPADSIMWLVPPVLNLIAKFALQFAYLDQCEFGASSKKPTRFLISHAACGQGMRVCSQRHKHKKLLGTTFWHGRWVRSTKAAQVYPQPLCRTLARAVCHIHNRSCPQFCRSFALVVPAADRKRALGQAANWKMHRQAHGAALAQAAGYQLKRGAVKPLLDCEVEPGEAIEWALKVDHPFSVPPPLSQQLLDNIQLVTTQGAVLNSARRRDLEFWKQQAALLLPHTARMIDSLPDPALRRLLRGGADGQPCQLGTTCHIALYKTLLLRAGSLDKDLPKLLLNGFPIVGPISKSGRWPAYEKQQTVISIEHALARAWETRAKILKRVRAVPVSDELRSIWKASLEDVADGSCLGPFATEAEVSACVGADDWIPTQRFAVVQKNKVRGCDSATSNLINQITQIVEKLQLPGTDLNVAALRELRSRSGEAKLKGWVLDEKKAYRQVPIAPEHRKFSVICLKDPDDGQAKFFVMVGHSFGLVSAVYNYNRRSAAINEILEKLFGLVAFNFYDDKYGFETEETIDSAHEVAIGIHWLLGAGFEQKKLQKTSKPVVLGVTYDLDRLELAIKDDRKEELVSLIDSILESGSLDPGSAGKLKGKLMFGASHLWGKVGRAFLRPLSERQYSRDRSDLRSSLSAPLRRSLVQWKKLIREGPPRQIALRTSKPADVVIFTDGFAPDLRKKEKGPERIGAVCFDRRGAAPIQFSEAIPEAVIRKWVPRATQIFPVELIAPVLALATFADQVRGRDVVMLIDSEGVEAALIKGYSSHEDLVEIIEVFWGLAFELRANVFIDRVSTDGNPADWPSRNNLVRGTEAGWQTAQCCWPPALVPDFHTN